MVLGIACVRVDEAAESGAAENVGPVHSCAEVRDNGFSSDHGLTFANKRLDTFREIEIGPAAEADDPKTISATNGIAFAKRAQYAASDQTGDLHHGQFAAVGQPKRDRVPIIGLAGLVHTRVQEGAMSVSDACYRAISRHPVHMNIQHRKKDRDTPPGRRSEPEFRGWDSGCDRG